MNTPHKTIPLFALFVGVCVAGCDAGNEPAEPVTMADLGLEGQSYDDVVPADFQSTIERGQPFRTDDNDDSPKAGSTIFSTPESSIFPMPRQMRSFESKEELVKFVADTFGAHEFVYDEDGNIEGARGSYVSIGRSYFEDADLGLRFQVTEPVLAFTGGAAGQVKVGDEVLCIDPDGDCSTERASYLDPMGLATAPTHDPECGSNGVCVEFHSFYNRTWFPVPWARHGTNVRFTTFSALPSTRFSVGGAIHVPPGGFDPFFWSTFSLPNESNQGQDSVESAVWCFGSTACAEYQATAVCGRGSVSDPDINRTRNTGNGPANNSRCPS